jgi:hypothetical protein
MRKTFNILTVVIIIVAIGFLVYGFGFSKHQVYNKPASDTETERTSQTMTEPQLLDQMCYDGITLDKEGNLQIKEREKACST